MQFKQFTIESVEKQNQLQHKLSVLQSQLADTVEREERAQAQVAKLTEQTAKLSQQIETREREWKEV